MGSNQRLTRALESTLKGLGFVEGEYRVFENSSTESARAAFRGGANAKARSMLEQFKAAGLKATAKHNVVWVWVDGHGGHSPAPPKPPPPSRPIVPIASRDPWGPKTGPVVPAVVVAPAPPTPVEPPPPAPAPAPVAESPAPNPTPTQGTHMHVTARQRTIKARAQEAALDCRGRGNRWNDDATLTIMEYAKQQAERGWSMNRTAKSLKIGYTALARHAKELGVFEQLRTCWPRGERPAEKPYKRKDRRQAGYAPPEPEAHAIPVKVEQHSNGFAMTVEIKGRPVSFTGLTLAQAAQLLRELS